MVYTGGMTHMGMVFIIVVCIIMTYIVTACIGLTIELGFGRPSAKRESPARTEHAAGW